MFYRMKIRLKTSNVAEVDSEKCEGGMSRHLGSIGEEQSDLRTFMVLSPEGDSEAGVGVTIFSTLTAISSSGNLPWCHNVYHAVTVGGVAAAEQEGGYAFYSSYRISYACQTLVTRMVHMVIY